MAISSLSPKRISPERLRRILLPPPVAVIQAERARRTAEREHGTAAEGARRSLSTFWRMFWPVLEPGRPLIWNWHLDIMCDAIERQARGEIDYRKLLILVPPGTAKSIGISVMGPAWEWLENPTRRKISLSNDGPLAVRDSKRMRDIIVTSEYIDAADRCARAAGRELWRLAADQNEKVNFENTARGFRQCLAIGAAITGKRGDDILIDDAIDAKDVLKGSTDQIRTRLREVCDVIDTALPTRVNDLATARWTLIMQRVHLEDPAAHAIAEGDWHVIELPMEFRPESKFKHPNDPRTKRGELLFPAKFPEVELAKLRKKMGAHYDAQFQQDPKPLGGGVLKRHYWRFWYPAGMRHTPAPIIVPMTDGTVHACMQIELPGRLTRHTQSWDMAFKDTKDSAYVVGQVWAEHGPDSFLLDQVRDKMDFVVTIDAVKSLTKRWPQALRKLVEDKANGPAVLATLRVSIPGFESVEPKGGKESRANAAAPTCRSGNVYLPHPAIFSWVNELVDELEAFPSGAYADQCLVAGTMVATLFGEQPIEEICRGQWVLTPTGPRRVTSAGCTGIRRVVERIGIRGTEGHPVYVEGLGFVALGTLTQSIITTRLTACGQIRWALRCLSNSWASHIDGWDSERAITSGRAREKAKDGPAAPRGYMSQYGLLRMARRSRAAALSIIVTAIRSIITLQILRFLRARNTRRCMRICTGRLSILSTWRKSVRLQPSGTDPNPAAPGTGRTARTVGASASVSALLARHAERAFRRLTRFFAQLSVATNSEQRGVTTMLTLSVGHAEKSSMPPSRSIHPNFPRHVVDDAGSAPVFNLTVDGGVYYANGILVHNCDTLTQYLNERYIGEEDYLGKLAKM